MNNLRKYGVAPFKIAVIHGGPGAPGEMAPVAKELSEKFGVLEPLQTRPSIEGQVQELKDVLKENGDLPIILIGHSWGAWLSYLFTAQNPSFVKKLILISSGTFEKQYAETILENRLKRLSEEEGEVINSLLNGLKGSEGKEKDKIFAQLGKLISKADSYDSLPHKEEVIKADYEIYKNVWKEGKELRDSGKILEYGKQIQCPVVAIHGDYDPHQSDGVKIPLSKIIKDFRFILLEKCGHYPWYEKEAKDKFYEILKCEL